MVTPLSLILHHGTCRKPHFTTVFKKKNLSEIGQRIKINLIQGRQCNCNVGDMTAWSCYDTSIKGAYINNSKWRKLLGLFGRKSVSQDRRRDKIERFVLGLGCLLFLKQSWLTSPYHKTQWTYQIQKHRLFLVLSSAEVLFVLYLWQENSELKHE